MKIVMFTKISELHREYAAYIPQSLSTEIKSDATHLYKPDLNPMSSFYKSWPLPMRGVLWMQLFNQLVIHPQKILNASHTKSNDCACDGADSSCDKG